MFSISEAIKYGWAKLRDNKAVWASSLVILILTILSSGGNYTFGRHKPSFNLISFIAFIALLIARVGYTKLLIKISDGESFDWAKALEDTFKTHGLFWKFFWTSILSGLAICAGFILLIVPGLFALSAFSFATLISVDMGLGPVAAMKESLAITKGNRFRVLLFIIAIIILNMLGFAVFGLGLIITIPVSTFAMIHIYRFLSKAKASLAPISSPNPTATPPTPAQ